MLEQKQEIERLRKQQAEEEKIQKLRVIQEQQKAAKKAALEAQK
jgi:hypothetical protein